MFKVGDKVKCVDFTGASGKHLKQGEVYLVKDVAVMDGSGSYFIDLEGQSQGGFYAHRFVFADEETNGCICTIQVLMTSGCKCGVFQKEQTHV